MYNGIGLQTPRGSGTNGYVQRNMSFVPKSREKVNYRTEEDIKKLDALANKKPNEGILAHERKRLIELKCFEMQELMEEQGYPEEEIESKVAIFRKVLTEKDGGIEREIPKDEFGRPSVKESHQMAEANQEKNLKMREALGISQYFVEGSSLDPTRKAKEAAAAEEAKKKYTLIPDSSSSSPERPQEKEKVKKRKKKKSFSSHEKLDSVSTSKKKKSSKKHKKDRSVSLEHHKKKKSKKSTKDKAKHKSKKARNRSSSTSSVASSSSADDESSSRSSSISSLSDAQSDASSYKKHKHSVKSDRSHKTHKKRSSSPDSAPYTKESRSRKDLYEAKKGKRKKKSARSPSSSSSEDDSSPKQYYRLEPVLLKSKSKHKKTRQFIEVPTKSAYELKKHEKKKRAYESSSSSSSSSGGKTKPESKRRKHSSSPDISKYHFSRNEVNPSSHKRMDSSKVSKRQTKNSCSPADESGRYGHSRSPENLHKSKHKKKIPEEGSSSSRQNKSKIYGGCDDKSSSSCIQKEAKCLERRSHKRTSVSPSIQKKSESLKSGYKRKESASPRRQHSTKDRTPIKKKTSNSPKSKRKESRSPKLFKRNESESPKRRRYKESSARRSKDSSESPKHHRHKEGDSSKHHRHKVSESPGQQRKSPRQHPKSRHSESPHCHNGYNERTRSVSAETGYSPGGQSSFSPFNEEKFLTQSPSFPPKYKHKKHVLNESPPTSSQPLSKSKLSLKTLHKTTSRTLSGRSPSKSPSPDDYYIGKSKQRRSSSPKISKRKPSPRELSPLPRNTKKRSKSKSYSPENTKCKVYGGRSRSSSVLSSNSTHDGTRKSLPWKSKAEVGSPLKNLCSSPNSSKESLFKSRNTPQKISVSPERKSPKAFENSSPIVSVHSPLNDSPNTNAPNSVKRRHNKQGSEDSPNKIAKMSPLHARNKNSNSDSEKIFFNIKSISIPQNLEDKSKLADENKTAEFSQNTNSTRPDNPKGKFCFGSFSNQDPGNVTSSIKTKSTKKDSTSRNQEKNRSETPESVASCSRSLDKSKESIQRTTVGSHSRSRSTSAAQSCSASGSDRSSRSRSYSNRRSKSFSKSHSKSYSKSPSQSRSKSRSKSFSRSRSKSYSRSRSRSVSIYSRSRSRSYSSRSRSRSIARSPSIPRRRGSPSFLDKRRITS